MTLKETPQTLRIWASASFPDDFAKFGQIIKTSQFVFSHLCVQAGDDGSPVEVVGIQGKGTEAVSIGHERVDDTVEFHEDWASPQIDFAAPFCWVGPTESEVGAARFEALVSYLLLAHRRLAVMKHRVEFFREHFPGACRDVAAHVEGSDTQTSTEALPQTPPRTRWQTAPVTPSEIPAQESAQTTRTPFPTPADTPTRPPRFPQKVPRILRSSSAQATPQPPATPTAPSLASSELTRIVDTSLGSVRASVLAHIAFAQQGSIDDTNKLQSKIRDLELELTNAENDNKDLSSRSTSLNNRIGEFEKKLHDVEAEKNTVVTEAAGITAKTIKLEEKLVNAEKAKERLESESTSLNTKLHNLNEEVVDARRATTDLEASIEGFTTKTRKLEAKLEDAEKGRRRLKKERAELSEKLAAAQLKADEAEKKSETWKALYEDRKEEILGVLNKPV